MTQPLGIVRGAALIGAVLVVVVAGCGRSSGDEKSEGKGASHSTLVTSATGVAQPDSTGESKAPAPPVPPSAMDVTSTRPATSSPPASVDLIATAVAEAQAWPMRTKLAQLMFIGFNTGYRDTPGTSEPSAAQDVIDAGVGGVFVGRKELDLFNSPVFPQAQSGPLPLLVATDGEGGRVDPLPQVATPLPPAREMAAWDSAKIRKEASSTSPPCWTLLAAQTRLVIGPGPAIPARSPGLRELSRRVCAMRASIPRSNTFLATDALTLTPIFNPRRPQTLRPWRALTFSHFESSSSPWRAVLW